MTQTRMSISVDPELARDANRIARRQRWSRSAMVERALDRFVRQWKADQITAQLNEIYSKKSNQPDRKYLRAMLEHYWERNGETW